MTRTVEIHRLVSGPAGIALEAEALKPPAGSAGKSYSALAALHVRGAWHIGVYDEAGGTVETYRIRLDLGRFEPISEVAVGRGWDHLEALTFADTPHLLLYRRDPGRFQIMPLGPKLEATTRLIYQRYHPPAATRGFTTVRSFVVRNGVAFLGYDTDTGAVAIYSLAATVASGAGRPPLAAHLAWSWQWSPGWTRFAFFRLGAQVFFLKTNTRFPNVNIDHVQDVLAHGTSEVATDMELEHAQFLSLCEPFSLGHGEPHFAAYQPSGELVLYRIHADCQGWTRVGSASIQAGATSLVVLPSGRDRLLISYRRDPPSTK